MLDLGGERSNRPGHGPIFGKSRRRSRAPSAASGTWLLGGRGPRALRAAGLPGLLGKAPRPVFRRQVAIRGTEGQAKPVRDLQPAVSDFDQGRIAYPELSGSADQAAERREPEVAAGQRSRAGEEW